MGDVRKDLRFYELEEEFGHITPRPRNAYVPLPLQDDKESDVSPSESVPIDEGNDTQLCRSKGEVISCCLFGVEEKSFICAPQNYD